MNAKSEANRKASSRGVSLVLPFNLEALSEPSTMSFLACCLSWPKAAGGENQRRWRSIPSKGSCCRPLHH